MKKLFSSFAAIAMILGLNSCEHKELCYTHPHFSTIRVTFDWENISEKERPEGMRVMFFPQKGTGDCWIFDFPGGEGRTIELPQNYYRVISYNYDTEGIIWQNENSYLNFRAETEDVEAPDGSRATLTPSLLIGDYKTMINLADIPEDEERVVSLTPKKMVCHYTYEIHGVNSPEMITSIQASLSGMSGALIMAGDRLPDGLSESLLFDGIISKSEGVITGEFFTFGHTTLPEEANIFKLYLKYRSGKSYIISNNATKQVYAVPVTGHIGDVHITIYLENKLPPEPDIDDGGGDNEGGNTTPDSGFDVGADDWSDVNTDIIA